MNGKRLCSMGHPAASRGERARRFLAERAMGVLWHHSSVNLVEPRSIALAGPEILRRLPEIDIAVSIPESAPQPAAACSDERSFGASASGNFALTILA